MTRASVLSRHILLLAMSVFLPGCAADLPTTRTLAPNFVVRSYPNGCVPEVIRTTTDSTETILTTFSVAKESCVPDLSQWGIDMGDPMGVDTPQGNAKWVAKNSYDASGMPSAPFVAGLLSLTPPQVMIEFDPPVQSVEFNYSRLAGARAWWGGGIVNADSMQVRAMSRYPGTTSYTTYARKVLYSNVASTTPPWNQWDPVKLTANGDKIQWLWVDGALLIDDLRVTRVRPDSTFHIVSLACTPSPVVRANTVSCDATWAPTNIPAGEILFEWRFTGDSVWVFPAANAPAFDPPPPVDSTGSGVSKWSGSAVLGGRVSLRATWQGDVDSSSTKLSVSARTNPLFGDLPVTFDPVVADMVTDSTKILAQQPNPDPGGGLGLGGQNYDTRTKNGNITEVIHGLPMQASVPSGPNRGLWYVVDPGVQSTRGARLRTWISGRESPKLNYTLSSGLLTNRGLLQARRKTLKSKLAMHPDSAVFVNGIWAHETYGQNGRKGHQGQIELAAKSLPTCGRVPQILEGVVAADSTTARFIAGVFVLEEGKKSLYAAAWHDHVYGNYSNAPYYEVVSKVTVADNLSWLTAIGDAQGTANPSLAPDPQWNCGRVY